MHQLPQTLIENARRCACALILLFGVSFAAACDGDESSGPSCVDDAGCERGVCGESGVCVNPDDCGGLEESCLEGYRCDEANACVARIACDDGVCARGVCQAGACVNPASCQDAADCLEGSSCEGGSCTAQSLCSGISCDRGVCSPESGTCVNGANCNSENEQTVCIEDNKCVNVDGENVCRDEETFCREQTCTRGVCSFEVEGCADASPCANDSECLQGNYCDEADSTCKPNRCLEGMVMCSRGVCDPSTSDCVNPESCGRANDCLPMNVCVADVCVPREDACQVGGCPGAQRCEIDDVAGTAECLEQENGACTNALDCLDDRVCAGGMCSAPEACVADDLEPAGGSDELIDYEAATADGRLLQAGICGGDTDNYAFNVNQIGTLIVDLAYEPVDLGLGTLTLEVDGPGTNDIAPVTAIDGRARVEVAIDQATKFGEYVIRITDSGDVSTAGVRYSISSFFIDENLTLTCAQAPELVVGPNDGDVTLGATNSVATSCADRDGVNQEDVWRLELTEPTYVVIDVDATVPAESDLAVSIRSSCGDPGSEVACANATGLAGGTERIEALLEAGSYVVFVQSGGTAVQANTYTLSLDERVAVCTPRNNECLNDTILNRCARDGSSLDEVRCERGCDQTLDECVRLAGDLCAGAPIFDDKTVISEALDFTQYRSDYNPGADGCVPNEIAASGPDAAFEAIVPPGYAVRASIDSPDDTSLYVVTSCSDASASCEVGSNANAGGAEDVFWRNAGAAQQRVFLIADTAFRSDGFYSQAAFTAEVIETICTPGEGQCVMNNGVEATQVCNADGSGFGEPTDCFYGCDMTTGACASAPNNTCATPVALTSGVTVTGRIEDFTPTDELNSGGCAGSSVRGPNALYSIQAMAGQIVEVEMSTNDAFNPGVWASASCAIDPVTGEGELGACIAGANESFRRDEPEIFRFAAPVTGDYFISAASSSTFSASGNFELKATVRAPECVPGDAPTCKMGTTDTVQVCDEVGILQEYTCSTTCTDGFCDAPSGEVCVDSILLAGPSGTLSNQEFLDDNDVEIGPGRTGGCFTSESFNEPDGPDTFYRIAVQPGDVVDVSLDTQETDAYLAIYANCSPDSCRVNNLQQGSTRQVYRYQGLAPGFVFVVVDVEGNFSDNYDPYNLSWNVRSGLTCAPSGTQCLDANTVGVCDGTGLLETVYVCDAGCADGACNVATPGRDLCAPVEAGPSTGSGTYAYGNFDSLTNDIELSGSSCVGGETGGRDAFYKVDVGPGEALRASATSFFGEDVVVYITSGCATAEAGCVAGARGGSQSAFAGYLNTSSVTETMIVAVDGLTQSFGTVEGPFALSIDVRAPECFAGDRFCAADGQTLRNCTDFGFYDDYVCGGTSGTCTAGRCDTPTGDACVDPILLAPTGGTTGSVNYGTQSRFELPEGITNASCAVGTSDQAEGGDRFYAIDLPAGSVVEFDLVTTETDAALFLYNSCDQSQCLRNTIVQGPGSLGYANKSAVTERVTVIVDTSQNFGTPSPYTLNWTVSDTLICAPGEARCSDASTLALCNRDGSGEVVTTCSNGCQGTACVVDTATADLCGIGAPDVGQGFVGLVDLDNFGADVTLSASSCTGEESAGPDAFFRATVPPGKILRARSTSASAFFGEDPIVYIFDNCADPEGSCLSGASEAGSSSVAETLWLNRDTVAREVLIGVDTESSFADDTYRFETSLLDPECTDPPGTRTCDVDGVTILSCNEFGLYDRYECDGACGGPGVEDGRCANPSGEVCFDPVVLDRAGGTLTNQSYGQSNDLELPDRARVGACVVGGFRGTEGDEVFYEIDLLAGETLTASINSEESTTFLQFFEGCDQRACLSSNWTSSGQVTRTYYAAVDTRIAMVVDATSSFTSSDTFSLTWSVRSGLSCAPGQARCIDATTLGLCADDGLSETSVTCATACENGFCEVDLASNNACDVATAPDVGEGISVASSFDFFNNDIEMSASESCAGGEETDGPDAFFRMTIAPGELVRARVESASTSSAEEAMVYIIEDCAMPAMSCLAGAKQRSGSNPTEVLWRNPDPMGTTPRTVIIGVDNDSSFADELFALTINKLIPECTMPGLLSCAPDGQTLRQCNNFGLYDSYSCNGNCLGDRCENPTGEVCIDAVTLNTGATRSGSIIDQTFSGQNTYELDRGRTDGCFIDSFDENDGADAFYRFDLVSGELLSVELDTEHDEAYIFLTQGCGAAGTCLANNPFQGSGRLTYYADVPTSIIAVVDTDDTSPGSETYTLNWEITAGLFCAPGQFRCLPDGMTLELCGRDGLSSTATTCAHGCEDSACVASANDNDLCADVEARASEVGSGIAVYYDPDDAVETFTNNINESNLGCVGDTTDGPDIFYKASVAPGAIVRARVESYGGDNPIIYAFTSCANVSGTCVAGAVERPDRPSAEILWTNDTAATVELIIAGDSDSGSDNEPFGLFIEVLPGPECFPGVVTCNAGVLELCNSTGLIETYQCSDLTCNATLDGCANPTGDVCADVIPLTGTSGTVTGDFGQTLDVILPEGWTNDACYVDDFDQSDGNDLFYSVVLPNIGDVLRLDFATSDTQGHVFVTTECGNVNTCQVNNKKIGSGTIYYTATQPAERVFVTISRSSTFGSRTFNLAYEILSGLLCAPDQTRCAGPNSLETCSDDGLSSELTTCPCSRGACDAAATTSDTCAGVATTPLITGAYTTYGTYDTGTDDIDLLSSSCVGEDTPGNDTFVQVEVPAGALLRAEVDSFGGDTVALYIVEDCTMPDATCLVGTDETAPDLAEVYWKNDTAMAKTVIVVADSESSFNNGVYAFSIDIITTFDCTVTGALSCAPDGRTLQTCNEFGLFDNLLCPSTCTAGACDGRLGDTCLDAILVNPGGTTGALPQTYFYTSVAIAGATNQFTSSDICPGNSFEAPGPERFYAVELANGQTVDVDHAPSTSDASLSILSGCNAGFTCYAGSDNFGTESAQYTNNSGSTQTVYVVADFYTTSPSGTYDLTIEVR